MKTWAKFFRVVFLLAVCATAAPAATHIVVAVGLSFSPDTMTIHAGDTVQFQIATIHSALEVSKASWDVGDITPLPNGFGVPFGGGSTVITDTGTHYYVCQNHAVEGMKGIIFVIPPPPPPNQITIRSFADADGNPNTTGDRALKKWSLKLYSGSTATGAAYDSVNSGNSLTTTNLAAGTYLAVEADTAGWSHISVVVDGVSQGTTSVTQWQLTVSTGTQHTIDFINYAVPPNRITIRSFSDIDGNPNTTGDRAPKNWSLKLYNGSVATGAALDSINSGSSRTTTSMPAGTYLAVEADSAKWSHISVVVDGVPQGATSVNQWQVSVTTSTVHTVDFINQPPPDTITINSLADQDGNPVTTGDQIEKSWGLKLYNGSSPTGTPIDSVNGGTSLTVTNLPAGTYLAVEADSSAWTHTSVTFDGSSQGVTPVNQWTINVGIGENHTVTFINHAPHIIIDAGVSFLPESLSVRTNDIVRFVLEQSHTAREVSQATWLANDTVSDGGFDLPFGGGDVSFPTPGVYYYVCRIHASLGMKGRIFVTSPPTDISIGENLLTGWNLISLPVSVTDGSLGALYPTSVSQAFDYEGSYLPQSILKNGPGYWIKIDTSRIDTITGMPIAVDSTVVATGWNMIGSISSPVAVANVITVPSGIINSNVFGYSGSYFTADTIKPGAGYWIRVSQGGTIVLDSASGHNQHATAKVAARPTAGELIISDGAGRNAVLHLINAETGIESHTKQASMELPPLPPAGGFDVRFANNSMAGVIESGRSVELPISVTGARYPLSVGWKLTGSSNHFVLRAGGIEIALSGSGNIRLDETVQTLSLFAPSGASIPTAYALDEAYPNPFNPTTTIGFGLPFDSRVRLRIYNIIGQTVAELIDGVMPAGRHTAEWGPVNNSSGVYFVRLDAVALSEAASYSRVSKIILQK